MFRVCLLNAWRQTEVIATIFTNHEAFPAVFYEELIQGKHVNQLFTNFINYRSGRN